MVTAALRETVAPLWSGRRSPLLITGLAPLVPILIGSAVNIWYNLTQIDPLLTPAQRQIFVETIGHTPADIAHKSPRSRSESACAPFVRQAAAPRKNTGNRSRSVKISTPKNP